MAAGAGALNLELGGNATYHGQVQEKPLLGYGVAPVADDIDRCLKLLQRSVWLWVVVVWLLYLGLAMATFSD